MFLSFQVLLSVQSLVCDHCCTTLLLTSLFCGVSVDTGRCSRRRNKGGHSYRWHLHHSRLPTVHWSDAGCPIWFHSHSRIWYDLAELWPISSTCKFLCSIQLLFLVVTTPSTPLSSTTLPGCGYRCRDGSCLPANNKCDFTPQCPGGDDELRYATSLTYHVLRY